jgi:hypothetical protein
LVRAAKFEESFFADIAYRAGDLGGKKGRVIRSIIDAVKDYGPPETDGEFRDALECRPKQLPWTDQNWLGLPSG